MQINSLAEAWQIYERSKRLLHASDAERTAARIAFYAGAAGCLAAHCPQVDQLNNKTLALLQEMQEFEAQVTEGSA